MRSLTPEVTVLNPSDLFGKVKTCFSQKRYGCVIERLNMRTNEKSRRTADDGITMRVFMAMAKILAAKLERFE